MYSKKIIKGDCLKEMKKIKKESIDLIIADYPFNSQDGRKDYFKFVEDTSIQFERILKKDGNIVIINNPINIFKTSHFFHKFNYRNGITLLRKGSLRPAWMFGFQHNYCLILYKGDSKKVKWNGAKKNHDKTFMTDVINYQNGYRGKGNYFHPQAIPLDLTKKFVEILSNKNDLVLDPFLGSGTTLIACMELKRNFIGIELKEEYIKMIKARLKIYLELKEQRKLIIYDTSQSKLKEPIKQSVAQDRN